MSHLVYACQKNKRIIIDLLLVKQTRHPDKIKIDRFHGIPKIHASATTYMYNNYFFITLAVQGETKKFVVST